MTGANRAAFAAAGLCAMLATLAPAQTAPPPPNAPAPAPGTVPGSVAPPTVGRPSGSPPPVSATAPAAPEEDIRDIRGPKAVAPDWRLPALAAVAVALLAALGYGIWRWRRARRKARVLLPFERALQQLEEIRPLMVPATAREFSIAISDIVRRYIEERFNVTAAHRTTEEFLRDLLDTSNKPLARHRGLLAEFLQQCDLVKFAGVSLSIATMDVLHRSGRTFVLETAKPDPAEKPPI